MVIALTFWPQNLISTYEPKYICDQNRVKFSSLVFDVWCSQGFQDTKTHSQTYTPENTMPPVLNVFGGWAIKIPGEKLACLSYCTKDFQLPLQYVWETQTLQIIQQCMPCISATSLAKLPNVVGQWVLSKSEPLPIKFKNLISTYEPKYICV